MYAEALGKTEVEIDLREGATVADVLAEVRRRPGADRIPPLPLLAVNQRYAKAETRLKDGDEVALIPPVAGG